MGVGEPRSLELRQADRRGGHDVLGAGAARQVADRFGEPLQDRADSLRTGQVLGQLVGDIARIQVGKNQDVGVSGHGAGAF